MNSEDDNTVSEGTAQPTPDLNFQRGLEITCGDEELLKIVVAALVEESADLMSALRQAADHADADQIRISVHTLKGSLRTIGGDDLLELGDTIEKLSSRQELQDIGPKIDEFLERVRAIMPELVRYAADAPAAD